ncbi:MAG: large-conductance mechanosensitive channel protein MscL [Lentimicrobiaceae bacterium]|jgi:large conductance mechanosensitive channel|nr:large-conductance mechanosensitive channel protein MscL [Lentimicrobiaceae bacterium]
MKLMTEFKQFAMRGNVVDMAVGIIIGGAFGKIVSSLVTDVIMPPIGLLVGGINFSDIKIKLNNVVADLAGNANAQPVTINLGNFIQTIFDFLIVAFAIFMMIKALNRMKRKETGVPPAPAALPPPTNEEKLLSEIRDILKSK